MEVKNNKTENPLAYYREKFKTMDPEAMGNKSCVKYENGVFSHRLLNREVRIKWPEMTGTYEDGSPLGDYNLILVSRYIMEGAAAPAGDKMYSYPEMPWGPVYERQFKGRCINRLSGTYGRNPEGFKKACSLLGGISVKGGDLAYDIEFMPQLKLRLILWLPDEEFPANAQILFSENFPLAFTAEDMAVVGDVLLNAMKGKW